MAEGEDESNAIIYADKRLIKEAIKEAIKEWLADQFATFGRWSAAGLLSMGLAGLVYLFMMSNGWSKH